MTIEAITTIAPTDTEVEAIAPADTRARTTDKAPTFAFLGAFRVWLAAGVRCPRCGRQLHALDVAAGTDGVRLICTGCHRDVLTIDGRNVAVPIGFAS